MARALGGEIVPRISAKLLAPLYWKHWQQAWVERGLAPEACPDWQYLQQHTRDTTVSCMQKALDEVYTTLDPHYVPPTQEVQDAVSQNQRDEHQGCSDS